MSEKLIRVEICEFELSMFGSAEAATAYVCDKLQSAGVPVRLSYYLDTVPFRLDMNVLEGTIEKESDVAREMCIYTWYPPKTSRWQRALAFLKKFL